MSQEDKAGNVADEIRDGIGRALEQVVPFTGDLRADGGGDDVLS